MERSIISCSRSLSRAFNANCVQKAALPRSPSKLCTPAALRRQLCAPSRSPRPTSRRCIHTSPSLANASRPPKSRDRGPKSNEGTQTDFDALDVLRNTATPATSIDACTDDGFALNNQKRVSGSGVLLVGGEAFRWRPWIQEGRREGTVTEGAVGNDKMAGRLLNKKGQWEVPEVAWGVLDLVYPKPDLLIIGTGPQVSPIATAVRTYLNNLGIRLEIQDTRNAAAQFNLLATERGVAQVAAAMIPVGWKEGR